MTDSNVFPLTTARLTIRPAEIEDAGLFLRLWTDPRVMTQVGFPRGLPVSLEEIQSQIEQSGPSEFDQLLVVETRAPCKTIGECRMHAPDSHGIAKTDVKLLPEFWGHHYGVEIKRALLQHLFAHTGCQAVEATPNVSNTASIKMQEAVGGIRVGEQVHTFPEAMQSYTVPVHHYIYHVRRSDWVRMQEQTQVSHPNILR